MLAPDMTVSHHAQLPSILTGTHLALLHGIQLETPTTSGSAALQYTANPAVQYSYTHMRSLFVAFVPVYVSTQPSSTQPSRKTDKLLELCDTAVLTSAASTSSWVELSSAGANTVPVGKLCC